jgi:tetratricopeptide (TPR) repeat protein
MKIKSILITGALLVSVTTFAQKDELKALKKIYAKEEIKGNDLVEYKSIVSKLEPLATEEADKIYASFYKAMIPVLESLAIDKTMSQAQIQVQLMKLVNSKSITNLAEGLNATLEYEKKSGKKIYTDDINETITSFKPQLINAAVALGEANKHKEASDILYSIYQLDKKDQEKLYFAASYAVNAKDYDKALSYYNELKALNYTGEGTLYYAVNKATKLEEFFGSDKAAKDSRDNLIKLSTHEKPRDEKITSKKGEIYKNIVLILVEQGKSAEAKAYIGDARKVNPDDTSLMLTEADIYLKEKDFVTYSKLVNQALEKDPNNVDLVFNLGVISAEANKIEDAEKYYKKAIELDPTYFNAYLNLSELKLRSDKDLVDQMRKLGSSDADNKKFDVLRAKQIANYKEVLPFLEKAVELKSDNEAAKSTLLGVYQALEMTDKYKALKAKG